MSAPGDKVVAILQSNYIPWKGYLDIISAVDEFIVFDEVQFTRRDWRNRNKIINGGKVQWLTIPVKVKGAFEAPINSITVADQNWTRQHWSSIRHAYARAPFFERYAPELEAAYRHAATLTRLSEINLHFLGVLARLMGLSTPFVSSATAPRLTENKTGRLVEICRARGATSYLSGPAARVYIETARFTEAGISLAYADYSGYAEYDQAMTPFEHGVSVIDLLMRCGPQARNHLKSTRDRSRFLQPA